MNWIEITLFTHNRDTDGICARLEDMGISGFIVNDGKVLDEFLESGLAWDYIDESVEKKLKGDPSVIFYIGDDADGRKLADEIFSEFPDLKILTRPVRDEDWENNWKDYYKPLEIGDGLLVVPAWEDSPETGRTVIKLDPGMVFGTGSHETTRMCLEFLDEIRAELYGAEALDLGCGSGVLAIAALLLGAKHAVGLDLNEDSPQIAAKNAELNGIPPGRLNAVHGDITDPETARNLGEGKYNVILANIVADVICGIIHFVKPLLAENGVFICSGIIEGRQDEVLYALNDAGFRVTGAKHMKNWHAFMCSVTI
jgi:ribosomal protein L11 methyltransferase